MKRLTARNQLCKTPIREPLTIDKILAWADRHFKERGRWPNVNSGVVIGAPDEVWKRIDEALRRSYRGFTGKPKSSLAKLLEKKRGVRNSEFPPKLSYEKIATWAYRHFRKTGKWPNADSGPIDGAPGETWLAIDMTLRKGVRRGVGQSGSLTKFLNWRFGVRNPQNLPPLSEEQIVAWAKAHIARCGTRPNTHSGPVPEAPGETWGAIYHAFNRGKRGLRKGDTLARLLDRRLGARKSSKRKA